MSYDYQSTNREAGSRELAREKLASRARRQSHSYRFPRLTEAPTGAVDLLFNQYDALTEVKQPLRKAGKFKR